MAIIPKFYRCNWGARYHYHYMLLPICCCCCSWYLCLFCYFAHRPLPSYCWVLYSFNKYPVYVYCILDLAAIVTCAPRVCRILHFLCVVLLHILFLFQMEENEMHACYKYFSTILMRRHFLPLHHVHMYVCFIHQTIIHFIEAVM